MNRWILSLVLLVLVASSGCERRQPAGQAPAHARYTVGPAWQSDGYWFYPRDEASYTATGLAVVDATRVAKDESTADGERYDPQLPAAALQTLQLPVMLRVRNLENGREILVRVNDRGPGAPGRLVSLTPEAARLLAMDPERTTRVRLELDGPRSLALLDAVDGAPPPEITAAPIGPVQERSLMPGGEDLSRTAASPLSVSGKAAAPQRGKPDETVTIWPIEPGEVWIDAGHFSQDGYARRLAQRLRGTVQEDGRGRSAVFKVRVGPFDRVDDADAALDRARSAGVTGARIIVE